MFLALSACQRETSTPPVATPATPAAPTTTVAAAVVEPPVDAAFVLPGAFAQATSVADLEKLFGKSNIKVSEARDGDGNLQRSLVLFPDDPTRRAYVSFHDAETMTGVANILVKDPGSLWRGKKGVRVGMSFAELRAANGKPFMFSGFDDQGRGTVRDEWSPALDDNDETLGALDVEENEHMYFAVDLGLRGGGKNLPAKAYPRDDSTSSDDPKYPRLGEIVEVTALSAYTSLDDEWE
jgi:hypothetical protein